MFSYFPRKLYFSRPQLVDLALRRQRSKQERASGQNLRAAVEATRKQQEADQSGQEKSPATFLSFPIGYLFPMVVACLSFDSRFCAVHR
jgi:hypothetical protein